MPMHAADLVLDATHERAAWWMAAEPLVDLTSRAAPGVPRPALRLVVSVGGPRPAAMLAKAADPEKGLPGKYLAGLALAQCPGGAGLYAQSLRLVAGVLGALGEDAAESAIALAQRWSGEGGFVVVADPADGSLRVLLAAPEQDLSDALELGRLTDDSLTAH
jgi:hypothetical protein